MQRIKIEADMSQGSPQPEAVRLAVKQGPHTLRSADVDPANPSAEFDVDEGDYVASAQSLVPCGTEATAVFAVPMVVRVSAA